MVRKMQQMLDKTFGEILEFIEKSKTPREQINFKRKQLQFLKADVHKPKMPFRRCMLSLERKKERRVANAQRKRDLGIVRKRKK